MVMCKLICVVLVGLASLHLSANAPVTDDDENESTTETGGNEPTTEANGDVGLPWETSGEFEGDIVTPKLRNGILGQGTRWPGRVVPYVINKIFNTKQKGIIQQAVNEINTKTCIKLRPRVSSDKNWVHITDVKRGCSSPVGMSGGEQILNLNRNEDKCVTIAGTAIHELTHAIGLYHQQSTTDRDQYVKIIKANVDKDHWHNFLKYPASEVSSFGVPYDYSSIMHYGPKAFSMNNKETIIPINPRGAKIGQRDHLSKGDILKITRMYKSPLK